MLLTDLDVLRARPAGAHDDLFLKTLYASTRDDLAPLAADPLLFDTLIDMQWRAQRAGYRDTWPDAHDLILDDADGAAGRLLVETSTSQWRLIDIALLPRARGRGYGSAVLRALQGAARTAGAQLSLRVRRDNPAARRLYVALGFDAVDGDQVAEHMRWRGRPE